MFCDFSSSFLPFSLVFFPFICAVYKFNSLSPVAKLNLGFVFYLSSYDLVYSCIVHKLLLVTTKKKHIHLVISYPQCGICVRNDAYQTTWRREGGRDIILRAEGRDKQSKYAQLRYTIHIFFIIYSKANIIYLLQTSNFIIIIYLGVFCHRTRI